MAVVRPEVPDNTDKARTDAAAAASVPALRDAVVLLTESVARLEEEVRRLRVAARRGR